MPNTRITSTDIAQGTILNEDVAANADITRTKILGNAVTETAGGTVTGTIDVGGGNLEIPNGTATPSAGNEGRVFWDSDDDQLYVDDGAAFLPIGQSIMVINTAETTRQASGFVEIWRWKINLRKLFPTGLVFQIHSFNSGAGVQGTYRIFNVTDGSALVTLTNTTGSTTPTIYESSTVAATSIPNAIKEYTLEHERTAGAGVDQTRLRGSILRRP